MLLFLFISDSMIIPANELKAGFQYYYIFSWGYNTRSFCVHSLSLVNSPGWISIKIIFSCREKILSPSFVHSLEFIKYIISVCWKYKIFKILYVHFDRKHECVHMCTLVFMVCPVGKAGSQIHICHGRFVY